MDVRVMNKGEFLSKYETENPEGNFKQAREAYQKYLQTYGKQASNACLLGG